VAAVVKILLAQLAVQVVVELVLHRLTTQLLEQQTQAAVVVVHQQVTAATADLELLF
jgi:hypothetical protein